MDTGDTPRHHCGAHVVDAVTMHGRPGHDPSADWYCPGCQAYSGDQGLADVPPRPHGEGREGASIAVLVLRGPGFAVAAMREGRMVTASVRPGENVVTPEELDLLLMEPTWEQRERDGDVAIASDRVNALDGLALGPFSIDTILCFKRIEARRRGGGRPSAMTAMYDELADRFAGVGHRARAKRARRKAAKWRVRLDARHPPC